MSKISQPSVGDRVTFDDAEHGPQKGKLLGTLPLNSDKPNVGIVEVDHQMSGMLWKVEFPKLQRLAEDLYPRHVGEVAYV